MVLVEIQDVSLSPVSTDRLWGYSIDSPKAGHQKEVCAITIAGWVLGRSNPATSVEVMHEDRVIITAPVSVPRPDLGNHYAQVPHASNCGFSCELGMLGLPPAFDLRVQAILADKGRVLMGTIRGHHNSLRSGFHPKLQPLMITSLGRTGTTWLMRLLAEHPHVVAHRVYPYEARCANYWIHTLKVLSDPANHAESAHPDNFMYTMHWVGHPPSYTPSLTRHPQIRNWFGRSYPEKLAAFVQETIDGYYQHVAASQDQAEPRFFAEKYGPGHVPWLIWELYPKAREIILVRDLRDVFCSVLSMNAKRGRADFGRQRASSDEEYIQHLRRHAVRLLQCWKHRAGQATLLRYEALIEQPIETLGALVSYIGLNSSSVTIQGMLERASVDTPELQHHRTTSDPKASIGRWRRDLDASLQAQCEQAFGEILREFGYTHDGQSKPMLPAAPAQTPEQPGVRS